MSGAGDLENGVRVFQGQTRCLPHWGQHLGGLSIGFPGLETINSGPGPGLPDNSLVTKRTKVTIQKSCH